MPISTEGQPVGPHHSPGRVVSPCLVAHLDHPLRRKVIRPGNPISRQRGPKHNRALGGAMKPHHLALKASKVRRISVATRRNNPYICSHRAIEPVQRFARSRRLRFTPSPPLSFLGSAFRSGKLQNCKACFAKLQRPISSAAGSGADQPHAPRSCDPIRQAWLWRRR